MSNILVIVESPGKIATIEKHLNSIKDSENKYIVKASYGHCRDLDSKTLSIDVNDNYKPNYCIIPGKEKTIRELKYLVKDCNKVILAADEDREGEMIAASLKDLLNLKNYERIVFHEITKSALEKAIKNPIDINYNMMYAQQARRLLDRLVGYKISPILWKKLQGGSSAGRVQSIVVKIIIDKENEIKESVSNAYFKTTANLEYKKQKFNSTLECNKELYKFKDPDVAKEFLESITTDDIFKVKNITTKDSIRKASAPFTTSTLQQDASTKLHFNVKKTMEVAQKLYEAGMITYMRTDSTNLSQQAKDDCKKYIIEKYGKEYSQEKDYNKKSKNSQEAHEAIRPTKITDESTNGRLSSECERLYKLIRNRTLASQMSNAIIEVQDLFIDLIDKYKKSKLPEKSYFHSTLEDTKFDGYLILYNNKVDSDEETAKGKLKVKVDEELKYKQINICEEYSKLPLRFNEAGLVKHLEKNGIGRPSTYASIISKIIDKKYVEIKDIEGEKRKSIQMELYNSKKGLEVKTQTKDITLGKENKKISPTYMGNKINDFMVKNFNDIMQIDFTATFETYLDKIAVGKATWYNVLDKFYKGFSTIVKELEDTTNDQENLKSTDVLLGCDDNNNEIFVGEGKYGPYVKTLVNNKWKYTSIKDKNITLEEALKSIKFPLVLGKYKSGNVELCKGQYGLYIKYSGGNVSIKDENKNENNIDLEYAKSLIESGDPYSLKTFKLKDQIINIKKGPYGYYAQVTKNKKKRNFKLPEDINPDKITIEEVLDSLMKPQKKAYS